MRSSGPGGQRRFELLPEDDDRMPRWTRVFLVIVFSLVAFGVVRGFYLLWEAW